MARLRVESFTISIDGYGAGPNQSLENPLGVGGTALHDWLVYTRTFAQMHGGDGGSSGIDEEFAARGIANVGAWILGRNMFAPSRGPCPTTHGEDGWARIRRITRPCTCSRHPRRSTVMKGGTVFHFATDGIQPALDQAFAAASGQDVHLGGGVATIRQYLQPRLVEEIHLAIAPVLLGSGAHLLAGLDLPALGYACTESKSRATKPRTS